MLNNVKATFDKESQIRQVTSNFECYRKFGIYKNVSFAGQKITF